MTMRFVPIQWLSVVLLFLTAAPGVVRADEPASKLSFVYATKRYGGGDLVLRPLVGRTITRLTQPDQQIMEPAVSPDGKRIAYTSYRSGQAQIFVADINLSNEIEITKSDKFSRSPMWSPDGKWLVYTGFVDGNQEVLIISNDGAGTLRQLTADRAFDSDPCWSADGETIAFTSNRSGAFRLYTSRTDGGVAHDLLGTDLVACVYPCYSPDGKTIAFGGRGTNGTVQVFTVGAAGNDLKQITPDTTRQCSYATWSPDGRYISYVRFDRWPNAQAPKQDIADDKLAGDLMLYDTQAQLHTQLTAAEGPIWGPRASWLPLP
jgi:TolB protein